MTRPAHTRAVARLQSVDVLRGVVMIVMALDHIRDFFHYDSQLFSPEDLTKTTAALFLTRWVTHFCAPVFVFLAGTGSYLATRRGMSRGAVSRFLVTRGLWLVFVEMTLVLFGASFNLSYRFVVWQVIWAIGWSMVALSVLIYLPRPALLLFSFAMIVGHNALDGVSSAHMASLGWLWKILHEGFAQIALRGGRTTVIVAYPLIPWIGVMSAGYCFGRMFDLPPAERRLLMLRLGAGLTAAFVVLRWINGYGDPSAWSVQSTSVMTLVSFLRTSKYPPSLLYLLMTLGPSIVALGVLDRVTLSQRNPLVVFGRVPLFYYVAHWYLLHLVAVALAWLRYGRIDFMFGFPPALSPVPTQYPADYGYHLLTVYVVWAAIVCMLYPVCRWFGDVKARNRSPVLSYL